MTKCPLISMSKLHHFDRVRAARLHRNMENGEHHGNYSRRMRGFVAPTHEAQEFPQQLSKKLKCLGLCYFSVSQSSINFHLMWGVLGCSWTGLLSLWRGRCNPSPMSSLYFPFYYRVFFFILKDCIYNFMCYSFPDLCFNLKSQAPFISDNISYTNHDCAQALLTGNRDYHNMTLSESLFLPVVPVCQWWN